MLVTLEHLGVGAPLVFRLTQEVAREREQTRQQEIEREAHSRATRGRGLDYGL